MKIWFDMDGTIADLYGVTDWLDDLISESPRPYQIAKPMLNLNTLARLLNRLQKQGFEIGIISWLSKNGSPEYNQKVTRVKQKWLKKHLHSVHWDNIHIVQYGTNKLQICQGDILFDDEINNRLTWGDGAYTPDNIIPVLKNLTKQAAIAA